MFGFTKVTRSGLECAQCLHCSALLSNSSLRPSKLKNHRDKMHPKRKNEDVAALVSKRTRYDSEGTLPHFGFLCDEESVT